MTDTSTAAEPETHAQSVLDSIRASIDALQPAQNITIALWDCAPAEPVRVDPGDGTLIFLMTPGKLREAAVMADAPIDPMAPWPATMLGHSVFDLDAGGEAADALKAKIAKALGRGR